MPFKNLRHLSKITDGECVARQDSARDDKTFAIGRHVEVQNILIDEMGDLALGPVGERLKPDVGTVASMRVVQKRFTIAGPPDE